MEDVEIEADGVDVPGGPLAVLFTLTFRDSLSDQRKISLEDIARDECVRYLQTPHNLKAPGPRKELHPRSKLPSKIHVSKSLTRDQVSQRISVSGMEKHSQPPTLNIAQISGTTKSQIR